MTSHMNKTYRRSEDVLIRNVAGENMLVPINASFPESVLMMLSETGAFLWEKLEKARTLEELIEIVMDEFEGDKSVFEKDIEEFLNHLLNNKLISMEEMI